VPLKVLPHPGPPLVWILRKTHSLRTGPDVPLNRSQPPWARHLGPTSPTIGYVRLTAAEMEQLRELVMDRWDPIAVHVPENGPDERACYWTEYDDYLPSIVGHLDAGEGAEWLAAHLSDLRTKDMGLPARFDLDRAAAAAIVAWHQRTRAR